MRSGDTFPKAKTYAARAIAIDEQLAEAHTSMAYVNQGLWNWAEAEKEYKRAIELNPNYPTAQFWYARLEIRLGRIDEGIARLKLAQQIEPFSIVIPDNLIGVYLLQGEVDAAFEENKRLIELDPNYASGHILLNYVYIKKGQNMEAPAEAEKAVELSKRANRNLIGLVYALAASGKRSEAIVIVKELEEKYAKRQADAAEIAGAYAGLGEKDQAFEWLEKAFIDRSSLLVDLRVDPSFTPLRDDPRFKDLLKRMNLPE
jgi:tetratricopeptide (TPR) repeat protein